MKIRKKTENVYQVTPFGKFMRYLRNKNGETAIQMAERLDIGKSYLYIIELGIRDAIVPLSLIKNVTDKYKLSNEEIKMLKDSVIKSNSHLKRMDFSNISISDKEKILDYAYDLMLNNNN